MIRTTLGILVVALAASAAPVPAGAKFELKGWGNPVDPLGDCKFAVKDNALAMAIPGKRRDLSIHSGTMNAPRVLRDLDGDFSISVKVDGGWPVNANVDNELRVPFFQAGLYIGSDDKDYIRLERAQTEWGGAITRYVSLEQWRNGERVELSRPKRIELKADKPLHLKLVRKGDTVTGSYSLDGNKWTEITAFTAKLGDKVKSGLGAVHSTEAEFTPTFRDLTIN